MAGKRVNLADLASEPLAPEARPPARPDQAAKAIRVAQVAANPLNTRDLDVVPGRLAELVESIRINGQLQPCAVVSRSAFCDLFPEHGDAVPETADYVQVTGARRRAALLQLERPTIDVIVKDALAESRTRFLSATAAENIDREDYDPIEEARAVALLVAECGKAKDAAERLGRTGAWVSQRTNLLNLDPALQTALRLGEIPLREVRHLHTAERADQLAALAAWKRIAASRDRADTQRLDPADEERAATERVARRSVAATAIYRLGGTPTKIAATLRAELDPEQLRALAQEILAHLDATSERG